MTDDETLDRCADAYENEKRHWTTRRDKSDPEQYQVLRFRDMRVAGEFSEIYKFTAEDRADEEFECRRARACARAFIAAISVD